MRPILNATSLGLDLTAALSVTLELPRCSSNNCFAVMLALVVVVSCCTGVPFCQLKGYLDLLTATKRLKRGQTLHREWVAFWMHILKTCKLRQKELCDSPSTEQSVKGFLQSEGYTKAWILGLTVCFTTDLEDLNVTDKYCEPEQASTVKSNHRT